MENEIHLAAGTLSAFALSVLSLCVARFLSSQEAKDLASALGRKLGNEAEQAIAVANRTNNVILQEAVHGLVTYAITHEEQAGKTAQDKTNFVLARLQSNPKFASLGVTMEEVDFLVAQVLASFFGVLDPTTVQPATGGGPVGGPPTGG